MSLLRHPAAFAGGLVALGALLGAAAATAFKHRAKPAAVPVSPTPVLSKTGAPLDAGVAGKLVLVTGSSAGIGRAIAEAYARAGARVLVNGRSEASVSKAVTAIQAIVGADLAANVLPLVGDVSSGGKSDVTSPCETEALHRCEDLAVKAGAVRRQDWWFSWICYAFPLVLYLLMQTVLLP